MIHCDLLHVLCTYSQALYPCPSYMSSFRIPADLTPKSKPTYSKPAEIGCFSYDGNRIFHSDRSELVKIEHLVYWQSDSIV